MTLDKIKITTYDYYEAALNSGFAMGLFVALYYIIHSLMNSTQNFIPIILSGILILGFCFEIH